MSSQQLPERSRYIEDKAATSTKDHGCDFQSSQRDLAELRRTVTEDVEIRQQLQLAEIEFLKVQLDDLERHVRQKEKLESLIIEKRIESLLKGAD